MPISAPRISVRVGVSGVGLTFLFLWLTRPSGRRLDELGGVGRDSGYELLRTLWNLGLWIDPAVNHEYITISICTGI